MDIPKDFLSFEKRVYCMVTDESESPAMLESLKTVMQIVGQNPAVLDMPAFERILDMIGLAKIDLMPRQQGPAPPQQAQPVPSAVPA